MELRFSVSGRIARPAHEVFEAVVDPAQLSHYFTTGGAKGRLVAGTQVRWDFHDFPGAFPVDVIEVEPDRRIVLRWAAAEGDSPDTAKPAGYQTTVTTSFEALDNARTLVTISEAGRRETPGGLKASYGNCEGWTGMLCAMKIWLEHGVVLRQGFYK